MPAFANLGAASLEGASARDGEVFELGSPVALELGNGPSGFALSANSADQGMLTGAILSSQAGYDDVSGLASRTKPTVEQIKQMWKAIPAEPLGKSIFAKANNNDAYTAGTLTTEAQSFAKSYLNFIRYSAGLDDVAFDNALNANAAQGALILAKRNGGLTHTPETPEGITDAQAKPGKYACATSNISYSASSNINYLSALRQAIQGQVDDDSASNIGTLGHRRWLLKPDTSTMGIGSAYVLDGSWHTMYSAVRVFNNPSSAYYDSSYGTTSASNSTDYDFISWPASGNFANNVFAAGTPWSVTLNPNKFQTPSETDVTVTLSRVSDGKKWILNSADAGGGTTDEYFKVETMGYGVSNCIIFNPGVNNLNASVYQGEYRVDVAGLKTSSGSAASLSYRVNFFNADEEDISNAVVTTEKSAYSYTGSAITPPVKVVLSGKRLPTSAYSLSYKNNVNAGKATVTVKGKGNYTGSVSKSFTIKQAANTLKVSGKKVTLKAKSLKKAARSVAANKAYSIKQAKGKVSFKKSSGNKKIAVNTTNGKLTVKKGLTKGAYKVKVRITAKGTKNYKQLAKVATVTVKVK